MSFKILKNILIMFVMVTILPVYADAAVNAQREIKQQKKTVSLKAWKFAQQYSNNHRIRTRGEYAKFSLKMKTENGLRMIPWSYWTDKTNLNERIRSKSKAGLNTGLAVKVSALCYTLRDVYGNFCSFYPSMIRTAGKGVLARSKHRVDQGNKAVDLYINKELRADAYKIASSLNLTGIGVYSSRKHINMLHVDTAYRRFWHSGYSKRSSWAKLGAAHKQKKLFPPGKVLKYLGVNNKALAALQSTNGIAQYASTEEAREGLLNSNYNGKEAIDNYQQQQVAENQGQNIYTPPAERPLGTPYYALSPQPIYQAAWVPPTYFSTQNTEAAQGDTIIRQVIFYYVPVSGSRVNSFVPKRILDTQKNATVLELTPNTNRPGLLGV